MTSDKCDDDPSTDYLSGLFGLGREGQNGEVYTLSPSSAATSPPIATIGTTSARGGAVVTIGNGQLLIVKFRE